MAPFSSDADMLEGFDACGELPPPGQEYLLTASPGESPGRLGGSELGVGLDTYIWLYQHSWVIPVGIVGLILIPGLIGFFLGRRR